VVLYLLPRVAVWVFPTVHTVRPFSFFSFFLFLTLEEASEKKKNGGEPTMLNILSLGAGVQSSTVLLLSCRGELPKLDAAIFADTQWEPKAVYQWLDEVLEPEAKRGGIPLYRVTKGNIRADALRSRTRVDEYKRIEGGRWASMPLYTKLTEQESEGQIRRQCTKEYKIDPIGKKIRELWGEAPRTTGCVSQWMGISGDELRRVRTSRNYWIMFYYPLIFAFDRPWHRHDCQNWLKKAGYPDAPRSACLGCPYHTNDEWRDIQRRPEEWQDVMEFDASIRHIAGLTADAYLHRSCQPLTQIDFRSPEEKGQQNWLEECEGMCGV